MDRISVPSPPVSAPFTSIPTLCCILCDPSPPVSVPVYFRRTHPRRCCVWSVTAAYGETLLTQHAVQLTNVVTSLFLNKTRPKYCSTVSAVSYIFSSHITHIKQNCLPRILTLALESLSLARFLKCVCGVAAETNEIPAGFPQLLFPLPRHFCGVAAETNEIPAGFPQLLFPLPPHFCGVATETNEIQAGFPQFLFPLARHFCGVAAETN